MTFRKLQQHSTSTHTNFRNCHVSFYVLFRQPFSAETAVCKLVDVVSKDSINPDPNVVKSDQSQQTPKTWWTCNQRKARENVRQSNHDWLQLFSSCSWSVEKAACNCLLWLVREHTTKKPFPSYHVPLFWNQSWCETFHIKTSWVIVVLGLSGALFGL